ncbi:MAG: hypothetical protein AABZ08_09695 [Planctomycetota bacterium]
MAAKINRIAVGVLAIVVVFSASRVSQSPRAGARPMPNPKNSVGLIEHRGRYFFVEQLMDPKFRQTSGDPFVQGFEADTILVEPWAGTNPEKQKAWRNPLSPHIIYTPRLSTANLEQIESKVRDLKPFPWAGRNSVDFHD